MIKPIKAIMEFPIRELKREQVWIDKIDADKTSFDPIKTTFYQKWIHWWNGKKTIIGVSGTLICHGLTKIPDATVQAIGWIGSGLFGLIGSVGAIHKVFKSGNFGGKGKIKVDKDSLNALIIETVNIIKRWIQILRRNK